jgi:ATP synthase protein I
MNRWVMAFRLTGLGFFIGICIAGGALGGWWLGGERPIFLIVGLLVGLIVAIYGTYRMLKPLMNDRQDKEK